MQNSFLPISWVLDGSDRVLTWSCTSSKWSFRILFFCQYPLLVSYSSSMLRWERILNIFIIILFLLLVLLENIREACWFGGRTQSCWPAWNSDCKGDWFGDNLTDQFWHESNFQHFSYHLGGEAPPPIQTSPLWSGGPPSLGTRDSSSAGSISVMSPMTAAWGITQTPGQYSSTGPHSRRQTFPFLAVNTRIGR